jgi:hypothetical protein
LKVLPLDRILASKQAANRPKVQRMIPVLQNALRTLELKSKRRAKSARSKRTAPNRQQLGTPAHRQRRAGV